MRRPQDYRPALANSPDAWTIALKFLGDGILNGPGAFEIDAEGNAWVTNNYAPGGPRANVCPGKLVFKFTPTGQTFPGSPYKGGGIEGEGFGITFDPKGRLWRGNFGFQSPVCAEGPDAASNNSVTLLRADGKPLSPAVAASPRPGASRSTATIRSGSPISATARARSAPS